MDALDGLTPNDVRLAIRSATGTRPALFVPESSFELLVKRQIGQMEAPGKRCVDLVFEELQLLLVRCASQVCPGHRAIGRPLSKLPQTPQFDRIYHILDAVRGRCARCARWVRAVYVCPTSHRVRAPTTRLPRARFVAGRTKFFEFPVQNLKNLVPCTGNLKKLGPPGYNTMPGEDVW